MAKHQPPSPSSERRFAALAGAIRDQQAVVWSAASGEPRPLGDLHINQGEARFSYREDSPEQVQLSLLYEQSRFGLNPIVFPRREHFDLHPPLQALMANQSDTSVQRRVALAYLQSRDIRPNAGFDTDWAVLMVNGHGGIGHLDLFSSDEAARKWYADARPVELFSADARFGDIVRDKLRWQDEDTRDLLDIIGPTPSVGGMIPKFLLSIPTDGWDGRIGLPRRLGNPGTGLTDAVVKIEQSEVYQGLLELESLALEIHREAGFEVPRHWLGAIGDLPVLAVERFDRTAEGRPLHLESLHSIMAIGARDIGNHHSASFERIADALNHPQLQLVDDRQNARKHLLKRLVFALLTGNGDLHMQNLSILIDANGRRDFSPVYDPTPMRAFQRHDLLSPMPFGGYGDEADLSTALQNFTRHLGLRQSVLKETLRQALDHHLDFRQRLQGLQTVPKDRKQHLTAVIDKVASRLAT